jgi:hypothetical protein
LGDWVAIFFTSSGKVVICYDDPNITVYVVVDIPTNTVTITDPGGIVTYPAPPGVVLTGLVLWIFGQASAP